MFEVFKTSDGRTVRYTRVEPDHEEMPRDEDYSPVSGWFVRKHSSSKAASRIVARFDAKEAAERFAAFENMASDVYTFTVEV